jgi:hypothetical protein
VSAPRPARRPWAIAIGAIVGLAAVVWFLIRVVPKPSRASYPCQRAAFPAATTFVLWIAGAMEGWTMERTGGILEKPTRRKSML